MLLRKLIIHHHEFRGAGHEDRHIVLLVMIRILTGHLDQTHPDKVVHHLLRVLIGHLIDLGKILDVVGHACLLEAQKELRLLLGQDLIQCPVLRIICVHGP